MMKTYIVQYTWWGTPLDSYVAPVLAEDQWDAIEKVHARNSRRIVTHISEAVKDAGEYVSGGVLNPIDSLGPRPARTYWRAYVDFMADEREDSVFVRDVINKAALQNVELVFHVQWEEREGTPELPNGATFEYVDGGS